MKKICLCSSLSFGDEVRKIADELTELGWEVLLPNGIINHLIENPDFDPVQAKIDTDSTHAHVDKIREADAVLMCNFDKNRIKNYIGANCFCEMFCAKYFNKPIYALNPLPNQKYIHDELMSFEATVINGDLTKIKQNNLAEVITTAQETSSQETATASAPSFANFLSNNPSDISKA